MRSQMKKILVGVLITLTVLSFAGCTGGKASKEITVITREESSGTRGAFDELMKIKVKEGDKETSKLYKEAITASSTDEVAAKVEVDKNAIGYTSLGSINSGIKAVTVNGIDPTAENVKNGKYLISRPFVLAVPPNATDLANDFIKFIESDDGEKIVKDTGFIELEGKGAYSPAGLSGKLTLSGSTSVEKVMEKLREKYLAKNPNTQIEITYSGSGAGIKDALENKVNLGMSSRELTDEEKMTLKEEIFAHDGIAIVVNKANSLKNLTTESITKIFTGEIRAWSEV